MIKPETICDHADLTNKKGNLYGPSTYKIKVAFKLWFIHPVAGVPYEGGEQWELTPEQTLGMKDGQTDTEVHIEAVPT